MKDVIRGLNNEFSTKIQQIERDNPHDALDLFNIEHISDNHWQGILAVYAVKAVADPRNSMEVLTLDDKKAEIIQNIFWDMNKIDYWIESVKNEGTMATVDKDGNKTAETIISNEVVLHVHVTYKSFSDMSRLYGFNKEQDKMLEELMRE